MIEKLYKMHEVNNQVKIIDHDLVKIYYKIKIGNTKNVSSNIKYRIE